VDVLEEQRQLARKACERQDWQGALEIWDILRNRFLDSSNIFICRGDALQALGRLDEAVAESFGAIHVADPMRKKRSRRDGQGTGNSKSHAIWLRK
jgi:hypothetical protein